MKKSILPLLLVSFFSLGAEMAYANVPIGAAAFLAYPTVSYLTSSAVALIIAVALESLIFWKITQFKPMEALSAVFSANLVSSLFGAVVVMSFSSGDLFFIMLVPMVSGEREGVGRLVVKAVLAMNLCSYIVLSAVYGKSIFGFVLKAT